MDILCLHLTERPDGEGGNEAALPAVGTCVSHTQLPEPHSGESAATAEEEEEEQGLTVQIKSSASEKHDWNPSGSLL